MSHAFRNKSVIATTQSASGKKSNPSKQKNEIFVDILEKLNVLFSSNGYLLNFTIDGCIQMKSFLHGNPELRLALNEDLIIGKVGFLFRLTGSFYFLQKDSYHQI
jgi:AP-4 complex subunit mu-1